MIITSWVDGRRAVDVVYLDFNKVFDSIPSSRLLMKILNKTGLRALLLKGFQPDSALLMATL